MNLFDTGKIYDNTLYPHKKTRGWIDIDKIKNNKMLSDPFSNIFH